MTLDSSPGGDWPELDYSSWRETRQALHLWTQMVGKVRLALSPWLNHGWHVPLYVAPRGLTTSLIHAGGKAVEISFDLVDHRLRIEHSDSTERGFALGHLTVADFYSKLSSELGTMDIDVNIDRMPNELPDPVPFDQDHRERPYDRVAVERFHVALLSVDRVFKRFRTGFLGKSSPVHFFWGSFDLTLSRFSGRNAPTHPGGMPGLPDDVTREAYSHEVASVGFWPGDDRYPRAAFYAYAYPTPEGFAKAPIEPENARFEKKLGEFVFDYDDLRTAVSPEDQLIRFLQSSYNAAAGLGGWPSELETDLGIPRRPRAVDKPVSSKE